MSTTGFDPREARDGGQPIYAVLSALLSYPSETLLDALAELETLLGQKNQRVVADLLAHLRSKDLISLQEDYVATFDRRRAHSLHLFEHIHGESRDRGQAMVDLREEYLRHGLALDTTELPDFVPLFLEFLSQVPAKDAKDLLADAIHVLAKLGDKLAEAQSPYAGVFTVLRNLSGVRPQPLPDVPEDEEDGEAMVMFGPGADGPGGGAPGRARPGFADPAMRGGEQPVQFYPPGSVPQRPARRPE